MEEDRINHVMYVLIYGRNGDIDDIPDSRQLHWKYHKHFQCKGIKTENGFPISHY